MNLTGDPRGTASNASAHADRRIPTWAAGLLAQLARDRPAVVTREVIEASLKAAGSRARR